MLFDLMPNIFISVWCCTSTCNVNVHSDETVHIFQSVTFIGYAIHTCVLFIIGLICIDFSLECIISMTFPFTEYDTPIRHVKKFTNKLCPVLCSIHMTLVFVDNGIILGQS